MNKQWIIIGSVLLIAGGVGYWFYMNNQQKEFTPLSEDDKKTLEDIKII